MILLRLLIVMAGSVLSAVLNGDTSRIMVDQQPGIDMGDKLNNCIAALPAGGGICDATALQGAQTAAKTVNVTKNNVGILLGAVTLKMSGNPGINWTASNSYLSGATYGSTILSINSATADLLYLPSVSGRNKFSDLTVQSSVVRTAGAGMHIQGGNNTFERIGLLPIWNGMVFDSAGASDGNLVDKLYLTGGGSGAAWNCGILNGGIHLGTVSGNAFHHLLMSSSGPAFADAQICIQDGSDTITISDSQAVANLGFADAVAVHLELVNGGNRPSGIKFSNDTFEGGPTKSTVVIDSAFDVEFTNVDSQSGLRGLLVNSGTRVAWHGGKFCFNRQEGVRVVAAQDFDLSGARLGNNSLQGNNSFDDIFVAAGVSNLKIIGNTFNTMAAIVKLPKWNIEIAGTPTNCSILGNILPGAASTGTVGGSRRSKTVCTRATANFPQ